MVLGQPLILTLSIDETARIFYDDLRRRHFPSERNLIPAHLRLFHQLPDQDRTILTLREAAKKTAGFALTEPSLALLGRGVGVFFHSEPLRALHASLSSAFLTALIPQDRQRFRPHIVIQNKVKPETAKHTFRELQAMLLVAPFVTGLTLWHYLGGPWERLTDLQFGELAASSVQENGNDAE